MPKYSWLGMALVVVVSTALAKPVDENIGAQPDNSSVTDTYWKRYREGWFFYQDPMREIGGLPEEARDPVTELIRRFEKIEDPEIFRKEMEAVLGKAVMNPSDDNLRAYMYVQRLSMEKSSLFADRWQRIVWQTPELDYSLVRPVNSAANELYKGARRDAEASNAKHAAGQGAGLFFFYTASCPYCRAMAPTVKMLQDAYGIQVMAISLDGSILEEFPDARMNNGIAENLGVQTVPAIFLAQPSQHRVEPVAYGMLSAAELVQRLFVLMNAAPGEIY